MRIDFIAKDTQGKCAMWFRLYLNYKYQGFLKVIDLPEDCYDIKFKQGAFYYLFTINVPDNYVHFDKENMALMIDRPLVPHRRENDS